MYELMPVYWLEKDETMLEDACWLQPTNKDWHINLAELDAVVKGVNLALQWQAKRLHLYTNSLCVHHWVSNMLACNTGHIVLQPCQPVNMSAPQMVHCHEDGY